MIEQQLTLSDLPVSSSEIYEMMGYGNQTVPEPEIEAETQKLLKQISAIARPSFLFFSINKHRKKQNCCKAMTQNYRVHFGQPVANILGE